MILFQNQLYLWQQFSYAEIIVQIARGSLLTEDNLYNYFYRADARHEISWLQKSEAVSENVYSANL